MEIQELAGRISAEFRRRLTADKQAQRIIREGRDMADVSVLANRLGRHLRAAVRHHTAGAELPFGTEEMEQLAREILDPLLRESCSLTDRVFSEVQHRLDSKRGISLGPVLREFPSSRAGQIYRSAADPTVTEETILRRLSVPPETLINSHCDRTMQSNAKVRSEAGFETYIERTDDGKCCPWCSKMAGRYEYPDKTPKDVFRRHDNCGCRVVWVCGNLRQDVHSKQTWEQTSVNEPKLERNPDVTVPELVKNPKVEVAELKRGLLTEGVEPT